MAKKVNRGYDPNVFTVSTETKEVALIPNVGRFCKNKCGKRLKGKKVKRINHITKKFVEYELPILKNQLFCSKSCKEKFYKIANPQTATYHSPVTVYCRIKLTSYSEDGQPFRLITLYLGKHANLDVKITPDCGELWHVLDKIYKYRGLPKESQSLEITPDVLTKIMTVSSF